MKRILVLAAFASGLFVLGALNTAFTPAKAEIATMDAEVSDASCDVSSCTPCPRPCVSAAPVAMVADEEPVDETQSD